MPSQSQNQHSQPDPQGKLTHEIAELRAEVKVLRESIDEFREVVEWAVQNGRFGAAGNDDLDSLKHPPRPSPEPVVDPVEWKTVDAKCPFQLDTSRLSDSAKHDLERLESLIRIMPVRHDCDHDQQYFQRLRQFFNTFKVELAYLQEQTSFGKPCEIAGEVFLQSIANVRTEMHCFEARQKASHQHELEASNYRNSHLF